MGTGFTKINWKKKAAWDWIYQDTLLSAQPGTLKNKPRQKKKKKRKKKKRGTKWKTLTDMYGRTADHDSKSRNGRCIFPFHKEWQEEPGDKVNVI